MARIKKLMAVLELFGTASGLAAITMFLYLLVKSTWMGATVTLDFNYYHEAIPELILLVMGCLGLLSGFRTHLSHYRGVMNG